MKPKILKTSTVAMSLNFLLKGQLSFLNDKFEILAVSGQDIHLDEVAHREGVRIAGVPMERSIKPFCDLVSLWKLYLLFKKEQPLIVHSITPKAGLLSMLAAKMAGVPIRIHMFTGLTFPTRTGFMQRLLIKMDQLLCWAATNIYPEGKGVKNDLISFKITSKLLKVLANGNVNGIDLDFFSKEHFSKQQLINLKQKLGIQPNDFVFVFVGRLVGDKGINELVEAFKQICESANLQNCKLLLVGPLEAELDPLKEKTLKEIENNLHIISVGFQKDVRPYFAISDCLVFPSYREGFPNVVMQAGAMGLPSIVSNINGCNEIVIENKNGTIIPVKNTEVLKIAMQKMMLDTNYYNQLQQNARLMIQSRYEQKVVWEALLEEYQLLIDNYENKVK